MLPIKLPFLSHSSEARARAWLSFLRTNENKSRRFSSKAELFTHPSTPHRPPVFRTIAEFNKFRNSLPYNATIGFVPTMGALHKGHIQLVKNSKQQNEYTCVSIFVNPSQFLAHEDLSKYPRQLEQDLQLLTQETHVHAVFAPSVEEMYPESGPNRVWVSFEGSDSSAEGKIRPGHFRGVCTVVAKLFNIVRPTMSYFGQKDGMQAIVLKALAKDLCFSTGVKIVPTVRESDGLAMSSRNVYLSNTERPHASMLFKSLKAAQEKFLSFKANGTVSAALVKAEVQNVIKSNPLLSLQYASIASMVDGQEITEDSLKLDAGHEYMLSIAVKLGNVRLIDNIILSTDEKRHI